MEELEATNFGRTLLDTMPQWVLEEVVEIKKEPGFHSVKLLTYFGILLTLKDEHDEFTSDERSLSAFVAKNYEYLKERVKSAYIRLYIKEKVML